MVEDPVMETTTTATKTPVYTVWVDNGYTGEQEFDFGSLDAARNAAAQKREEAGVMRVAIFDNDGDEIDRY